MRLLACASSWDDFVKAHRGLSNIHPSVGHLPHPAAPLLHHLGQHGAPVVLATPLWTPDQLDHALTHGSHGSAAAHLDFLRHEMLDMVQKGFWVVLPYDQVRHLPRLRLSPIGVVPQRDRRPRTIVDYTFHGINQETHQLAPRDAMQFGWALPRLLHALCFANPIHGPVYMSKVDIADGFYRVWVAPRDVPTLGVAFPSLPGEVPLVAFPLSLPMGWTESPPYFCAFTETVADLANGLLTTNTPVTFPSLHRLVSVASTRPPPPADGRRVYYEGNATPLYSRGPTISAPTCAMEPHPERDATLPHPMGPPTHDPTLAMEPHYTFPWSNAAPTDAPPPRGPSLMPGPLAYTDVFVDDAIQLAQGTPPQLSFVRHCLLQSLDKVFRPLDDSDPITRQEPASVKKMLKGDACWATLKTVLGWQVDSLRGTIELPQHRLERLHQLFDSCRGRTRLSLKKWYQLLGELRSMTLAIPGGTGMFTQLQLALRHSDSTRVKLTAAVHDQLADFERLACDLGNRPTRIAEIVPSAPTYVGACDAARTGMGGVWFGPGLQPILWRHPFPSHIQAQLVSSDNLAGTITNSDLELAGILCHNDVLVHATDCSELTIATLCDNTPAVAWTHRASISSDSAAGYLLRLSALHRRHFRYLSDTSHIPGTENAMADDASRLWNLTDSQLLAHFDSHYPQPVPWRLSPLRPAMTFAVTSALQKQRPPPESFLVGRPLPVPIGLSGLLSVPPLVNPRCSRESLTSPGSSKSSHTVSAPGSWPVAASQSALERWRTTSVPLARASPAWGPRTRVSNHGRN